MRRLRVFSALLGCLAVVAVGLPAYASAWGPAKAPPVAQMAVPPPCDNHCPDCEGRYCPTMADGCPACVSVAPALAVAVFTLVAPAADVVLVPSRLAALSGRSPPPDPFPPRP